MTASSIHSRAERFCLCAGLALLLSAPAWPGQPEEEKDREARSRFEEATKQYNLGQFEEALKQYKAVYELKRHPGLLFNIAQCYRQLADYATAAFYYRRYRDEAKVVGENAQVVNGLIAEVEAKQAKREAHERALEIARAAGDKAAAENLARALAADSKQKNSIAPARPDGRDTIFAKWWFWTAAGVLVASATIYYALPVHPRNTSLGEIGVRAGR